MFHLTVVMDEPNLSLASHPHAIFQAWMWDLIKHINQNHPGLPEAKPPQPIKQWFHLTVWHHKTIVRLVSTQSFQSSRAFVSTQLPGLATQPTISAMLWGVCPTKSLGLEIQSTTFLGFQSVFPTRASRTSNSTRQGLLECLSNQALQD